MTYDLYTVQINVFVHTHKYDDINLDMSIEIYKHTYKDNIDIDKYR